MKKQRILSLATSLLILGTTILGSTGIASAATVKTTPKDNAVLSAVKVSPQTAGMVTIVSTSGANVRSGPGTNYSIIGTASYGAELVFYGNTARDGSGVLWFQVEYGSGTGWVSSSVAILR